MRDPDILDYIRTALKSDAQLLAHIDPILVQTRQTYGGDTIYVRTPERQQVCRRTLQRRQRINR